MSPLDITPSSVLTLYNPSFEQIELPVTSLWPEALLRSHRQFPIAAPLTTLKLHPRRFNLCLRTLSYALQTHFPAVLQPAIEQGLPPVLRSLYDCLHEPPDTLSPDSLPHLPPPRKACCSAWGPGGT